MASTADQSGSTETLIEESTSPADRCEPRESCISDGDRPAGGSNSDGNSHENGRSLASVEGRSKGVWSPQTIKREAKRLKLFTYPKPKEIYNYRDAVCGFRDELLDYAGYQLTMGPECYVSPADADKRGSVLSLDAGEAFFIPPGQFAFLLTEEVVRVPDNAFAFIALRSNSKFKGLVNVSGFHADPGFLGRLVFAVFNAGPGDVHLRRGEALFMIAFCDLDDETQKPRSNECNDSDHQTRLKISTEMITPLSGQIQSLAGLKDAIEDVEDEFDERLNRMERDVAIIRWAFAIIIAALAALLVRLYV